MTYLDTIFFIHATDDDNERRKKKKTKKASKSLKNAFYPNDACVPDNKDIGNSLVVDLAEESDCSLSSDPGTSQNQRNKKRSNKVRKNGNGECTKERSTDRLDVSQKKSFKADHHTQLSCGNSERDQKKEGIKSGSVGVCSANDIKKNSKAASFFMSKVRTLVILTLDFLLLTAS